MTLGRSTQHAIMLTGRRRCSFPEHDPATCAVGVLAAIRRDVYGRVLTECCADALGSMMQIGGDMHSAGTRLALAHGEYLPGQSCPQP
jgi:hypothetical protein